MSRVHPNPSPSTTDPGLAKAIQDGDAQGALALLERAGRDAVLRVVQCPWGGPFAQCPKGCGGLESGTSHGALCSVKGPRCEQSVVKWVYSLFKGFFFRKFFFFPLPFWFAVVVGWGVCKNHQLFRETRHGYCRLFHLMSVKEGPRKNLKVGPLNPNGGSEGEILYDDDGNEFTNDQYYY